MSSSIDLPELAREIAAIAARSTEPDIAMQLMELVDRLLAVAGLPSDAHGALPPPRRH